jgi:hypothetical protein
MGVVEVNQTPQVPEAARTYCPLSRNSANLANRSNHST